MHPEAKTKVGATRRGARLHPKERCNFRSGSVRFPFSINIMWLVGNSIAYS